MRGELSGARLGTSIFSEIRLIHRTWTLMCYDVPSYGARAISRDMRAAKCPPGRPPGGPLPRTELKCAAAGKDTEMSIPFESPEVAHFARDWSIASSVGHCRHRGSGRVRGSAWLLHFEAVG